MLKKNLKFEKFKTYPRNRGSAAFEEQRRFILLGRNNEMIIVFKKTGVWEHNKNGQPIVNDRYRDHLKI